VHLQWLGTAFAWKIYIIKSPAIGRRYIIWTNEWSELYAVVHHQNRHNGQGENFCGKPGMLENLTAVKECQGNNRKTIIFTFGAMPLESCAPPSFVLRISLLIKPPLTPVSVAQWANAHEPQCATRPDWLVTATGLGSTPGLGVSFSASWTNSRHALRLSLG